MPKPVGRKPKLNAQTQEKICQAIRGGNYAVVAARYAGISTKTYYAWLERGEREPNSIYGEFLHAIKDAESTAEVQAVAEVRLAGRESWQASMTWLERKFPDRWGRREKVEHSGPNDGPIQHEISSFQEAAGKIFVKGKDTTKRD